MGQGTESLFAASGSYDQAGHHAHIWSNPLKIFFTGTKEPMVLGFGMQHGDMGQIQFGKMMTSG